MSASVIVWGATVSFRARFNAARSARVNWDQSPSRAAIRSSVTPKTRNCVSLCPMQYTQLLLRETTQNNMALNA